MDNFKYYIPETIEESIRIYRNSENPRYLAGGMTLIAAMKQNLSSASDLIDLSNIKLLKGVSLESNKIKIGSLTTHNEIANSKIINNYIPSLSKLAKNIADNAIRNIGTIGGSICNADPSADYPAALVASNANIYTNKSKISANEFFIDMFETSLSDEEIVIGIEFPIIEKGVYLKFESNASKYAIVGVFTSLNKGFINIAVTGAANKVFLIKELSEMNIKSIKDIIIDNLDLNEYGIIGDINASVDYKIALVKTFIKKSIQELISK